MAAPARPRRTSSRTVTYEIINKFQGGISAQYDKVQMARGTCTMARNVEWLDVGGFFVRKGVGRLPYGRFGLEMAAPGGIPVKFHHYVRDPSALASFTSQYLVARDDGTVVVGVDFGTAITPEGTWLKLALAGTPPVDFVTVGPPDFAPWDTKLYLSLGSAATNPAGVSMCSWDGTVLTALGRAWVNDITAPTGGNMPPARYLAVWTERMWAAVMLADAAPIEGSRLRWSHPGRPEDWAENDYIDVGQQGDVITAIAPMRDMLIVFKRSSMYALLGSGSTNFRVVEVSGTIGTTGEWTRDNQGAIIFWDSSVGACRFDGKAVTNIFEPLRRWLSPGPLASITRCGGVVTDGEKIYVATDFTDFYGDQVPAVVNPLPAPRVGEELIPGLTTWGDLVTAGITWGALAGQRWARLAVSYFGMVWVYRPGAGWTSFTLTHPDAPEITMLGQVASRPSPTGDIESNRRIVYGLGNGTVPVYLSDRYDDGRDWWSQSDQDPIDAFYMTGWLHGGMPAQIKKWKAPRVIQEADKFGVLLIDVFYDFNYDVRRRVLASQVPEPGLSFDSYWVDKPGTIGRAKAIMLVIRPQEPRHWGVSSITIPVYPKAMR